LCGFLVTFALRGQHPYPGTAILGDIGSGVRVVERQPVEVIVGTVNDELVKNQRTFVCEAPGSFVTVRPEPLAVVDLVTGP
jgi:hypothetical protein